MANYLSFRGQPEDPYHTGDCPRVGRAGPHQAAGDPSGPHNPREVNDDLWDGSTHLKKVLAVHTSRGNEVSEQDIHQKEG